MLGIKRIFRYQYKGELIRRQINHGDMRKIHMTRQFFEAREVGVPNFRSISFFVWPGGPVQNKLTDPHI